MLTRRIIAALIAVAGLSYSTLAQDGAKPAKPTTEEPDNAVTTLKAGMPAPEFRVEKFLKGKEFSNLEKGKVYVIEFWATWCGPCVMSMPHLSELQAQYKDQGVTFCGVNVWEDKNYNDETLSKVTKFVEGKGDGMAYTVAYDGATQHMNKAWMKAAEQNGIPTAFVVDKTGTIAWIGHPMLLELVLDGVLKNTWDVKTGPAMIETANKAFEDAAEKYKESYAAGQTAWTTATKQYPGMAKLQQGDQFGAILAGGHTAEAAALGRTILKDATERKKSGPVMELLGGFGDPSKITAPEIKALFLDAAKANVELGDKTQPNVYIMLAQAYYANGETDKAREAGKKAVELVPEASKPRLESYLKTMENGK